MTEQEPNPSLRGALIWSCGLSVALCWLPIAGPFAAGMVGGRKARGTVPAAVAGLVPAIVWGAVWWLATRGQVTVGKDTFALAPLAPLGPTTALMLLGGALVGATGRGPRSLGVLLALGGAVWIGLRVNDVRKVVVQLLPDRAADVVVEAPTGDAAACEANLKLLHGAISLYAGSWDDCLPPADRWADALTETSGETDFMRCPSAGPGSRGYAMNRTLGGQKIGEIANRAATPLFYDSDAPGSSPSTTTLDLPKPGRHGGKSFVLYADGTVKQQ